MRLSGLKTVKRSHSTEIGPFSTPNPLPPSCCCPRCGYWEVPARLGHASSSWPRLQLVVTPPARGHAQLALVCKVPRPLLCLSLALYARCVIHACLLPPLGLGEALGSPKLVFYVCVFRTQPTEPLLPFSGLLCGFLMSFASPLSVR